MAQINVKVNGRAVSRQVEDRTLLVEFLRETLGLTGNDFREGIFSWRGFLYYKWSMGKFWPDVMGVLREINTIGSKANHFKIQQRVVEMKDELEKIKEQINNIV